MQLNDREEKIWREGIAAGEYKSIQFRDHAILVVADLLSQKKGTKLEQIKDEAKKLVFINKAKSMLGDYDAK